MSGPIHPMVRALIPADATPAWVLDHHGDLAELDELARRKTRRPPQAVADLLDLPVRLGPDGEIALYRLSLGAWLWLEECAIPWWSDTRPELCDLAFAFAMAHGRTPEAMQDVSVEWRARWIVLGWARRLRCSKAALLATAKGLMPEADPLAHYYVAKAQPDPRDDPGWEKVLVAMARESGQPAEHWLWDVSREQFFAALANWNDSIEATNNAARAKGEAADPDSYASRAAWAFRCAVKDAKARWVKEREP